DALLRAAGGDRLLKKLRARALDVVYYAEHARPFAHGASAFLELANQRLERGDPGVGRIDGDLRLLDVAGGCSARRGRGRYLRVATGDLAPRIGKPARGVLRLLQTLHACRESFALLASRVLA